MIRPEPEPEPPSVPAAMSRPVVRPFSCACPPSVALVGLLAVGGAVQAAQVGAPVGDGAAAGPMLAALDLTQLLALAATLGWAAGLRLYAVLFFTGMAGWLGWVVLPAGLVLLQHPLVLAAAGVMLVVEFCADKFPWLDSAWDAVHTVLRIPAGAALAAGVFGSAFGGDGAAWSLVAALAGGTLAASAHAAKAGTRAVVNASPEPLSNIGLSLAGDVAVPVLLWLGWVAPWLALGAVACGVAIAVWLGLRLHRWWRARTG